MNGFMGLYYIWQMTAIRFMLFVSDLFDAKFYLFLWSDLQFMIHDFRVEVRHNNSDSVFLLLCIFVSRLP